MAKYTVELRDIIRQGHTIFDFPYDFYDETKKKEFEEKFIKHFYFREIGFECVERFKWFLEEKMLTVFPYYNQLMKTNQVEYSILDNYNITETTTIERANEGKSASVSSTRGETFDEQQTDTNDSQLTDTSAQSVTSEDKSQNVSEMSSGSRNGVNTSEKNVGEDKETVKQFLDTPSGKFDLNDSKYFTNINHDKEDNNLHSDETGATSETVDNDVSRDTTEKNGVEANTARSDISESESHSVSTGKQTGLTDNNTRAYSDSKQSEVMEVKRKGNIGVDTDADMIQKHIKLQQILAKIERMFFDECEDLFMLVY